MMRKAENPGDDYHERAEKQDKEWKDNLQTASKLTVTLSLDALQAGSLSGGGAVGSRMGV